MSNMLIVYAFFLTILLVIVYFSKKRLISLPNKIYSIIIIINLIGVILEMLLHFYVVPTYTGEITVLGDIIMRLYLFYLVIYVSIFGLYIFIITFWAKPIVDILVEIPKERNLLEYKTLITNNGYICMSQSEKGLSFNKGYTENGFAKRVFHLHLRYIGDNNELYFRDYLIEHPDVAKEYENLKLKLWKKYEHNRDGYTNAKTEFVQQYTEKAKLIYSNRY